MKKHTVHAFDEELERIRSEIDRMGSLTVAQVERALACFGTSDEGAAERTLAADSEIDALEHEVASDALQLLALRQPMAADLRETLAAIRIGGDLERIGDLAKGFARRTLVLKRIPQSSGGRASALVPLGERVLQQLREVLAAYRERDAERAATVWRDDAQIDDLHEGLFRELLTGMIEEPRTVTACTHLAFMAKDLERAGDHCTRIADAVHYLVTAKGLPDRRPKGADARTTIVQQPGDQEVS